MAMQSEQVGLTIGRATASGCRMAVFYIYLEAKGKTRQFSKDQITFIRVILDNVHTWYEAFGQGDIRQMAVE